MAFQKLYPPIRPYSTGFLEVENDTHSLYWEQSGNPDGVPIILLHGGPGAGATEDHRRFFDPEFYRIIIMDQRGAGRSEPLGAIEGNTPDNIREDIELLRQHLRIGKWHVFGGSWGAALALMYAAKYAHYCASLILRSIFLCTKNEVDWFLCGTQTVFPEVWDRFAQYIPENERDDLLEAYYKRVHSDDEEISTESAMQWVAYESACATLYPHFQEMITDDERKQAVAMARIETHFYKYHVMDDDVGVMKYVDHFRHVPATIVHGRYDMITPLKNAHALHKAWPEADYIIVPDGGHSALDPAIRDRLIGATDNARSIR